MIDLQSNITGINSVLGKLRALEQLTGVEEALNDGADAIIAQGQIYPPERAGQRYVRTFELRDSFRKTPAQRTGNAITVKIENVSDHAGAVIGDNQAPIHQGRWKPLRKIGEDRIGAIRAAVSAVLLRSWGQ